jgi:hypothetical protein
MFACISKLKENSNRSENQKLLYKSSPIGIIIQLIKLKTKIQTGANTKTQLFDLLGIISSFKNNFKASAIGCNKPQNPTIFGPLRL